MSAPERTSGGPPSGDNRRLGPSYVRSRVTFRIGVATAESSDPAHPHGAARRIPVSAGDAAVSVSAEVVRWPLERLLFAIAGTVTLVSAGLALISPWFLLLTAVVGLNQLLYVAVGQCPMSMFLEWRGVHRAIDRRTRRSRPAAA